MAFLALSKLKNRSLLRLKGPDCYAYMQGLICNDLRILYEKDKIVERKHARTTSNVLSTFMLNAQGRAICDLLIYRTPSTRTKCEFLPPGKATEADELLIECDRYLASGLANTLYGYRVRRKIAIKIEQDLHLWSLFPSLSETKQKEDLTNNLEPVNSLVNSIAKGEILSEELIAVPDPRLMQLGMRLISQRSDHEDVASQIYSIIGVKTNQVTESDYILHRYALGVGEGYKDHPESDCLPLECNADFLGSVSYSKGCYLGQELTARIHYTGVIRKRLMPINIVNVEYSHGGSVPMPGQDLVDPKTEKKVGIIRNLHKNKGLGLIRTDLLPPSGELRVISPSSLCIAHVPYWWDQVPVLSR